MGIDHCELEVIVEFAQGRMIPRRIRYYDLNSAVYEEKDITSISYEIVSLNESRYGVGFHDGEAGILRFIRRTGCWQLVGHL